MEDVQSEPDTRLLWQHVVDDLGRMSHEVLVEDVKSRASEIKSVLDGSDIAKANDPDSVDSDELLPQAYEIALDLMVFLKCCELDGRDHLMMWALYRDAMRTCVQIKALLADREGDQP